MKCTQARRFFGAYWDDELTQAEREWLESHFAGCDACRTDYEAFAHSLELVAGLPRVEVEPGLAQRALAKARRATPTPDRLPVRITPRWIPITAAAVLLATAGAMVLQWTASGPLAPSSIARLESAPVREPVLVTPTPARVESEDAAPAVPNDPALAQVATIPDSLFDPSADIEFILDPVTLRKGRAHPASRIDVGKARGEQAVITF